MDLSEGDEHENVRARLAQVLVDAVSDDLRGPALTLGVLAAVGEALDGVVVSFWAPDPDAEQLRCDDVWTAAPFPRFEAATRGALFPDGVGLPGRVWERGTPVSVDDLRTDSNFIRRRAAEADGLRSGVAFPVSAAGRPIGVVECLRRSEGDTPSAVLDILVGVGPMIGTLLDRGLADEERSRLLDLVQTERARLDGVLRQLPLGVIVSGPSGEVILVNDRVADLLGMPDHDGVHRIRPVGGHSFVPGRDAAIDGTVTSDVDVEVRSPTGRPLVLSVSSVPVYGADGAVVSAVTTLTDVTERRARQARSELLAEAGDRLSRSLDIDDTLAAVARMSVPRLADLCIVYLVEPHGRSRRVAFTMHDENMERVVQRLHDSYGSGLATRAAEHVLRTGEPVSLAQVDDEALRIVARDPQHYEVLRELGVRSVVIVPLTGRGETLGVMTFATTSSGRELSTEANELAIELGRRAGLAVANAQLYRQARNVADALQASLVPPRLPEVAGLDLAARFVPGGDGMVVGGDFYDVFQVCDGAWAVVIGDVCGKGAEAAALTSRVRHSVRALRERDHPVALLGAVNQLLLDEAHPDTRFCTLIHGVCELGAEGIAVRLASAGHPSPYVVRSDGRIDAVSCRGSLLGVFEDVEHEAVTTTLLPGDALVLYTDGVTEARSPEGFFGEHGLRAVLASVAGCRADEIAAAVCDAATDHAAGSSADDIAVLVVCAPDGSSRS
jgi:serine phosphatase RsbU (regulator of sigma subunit)/PAS domain-containing protein